MTLKRVDGGLDVTSNQQQVAGANEAPSPGETQDLGRTLLVFAHEDEASAFVDVPHIVTGVGKINAATALSYALSQDPRPERVLVLGTAGVIADGVSAPRLDTVYQIDVAVQHDFSLPSPKLSVPGQMLSSVEAATIATGDVFVQSDEQRAKVAASGAVLVDMETYAFVHVCNTFEVPLQVFKVPSDFADDSTTGDEWDTVVFQKSRDLRTFWNERLGAV